MFFRGGRNGMGCFVQGGKNGMGYFVRGDKNCMGCFVRGGKLMRDVLSGVLKNGMGCFVRGCFVLHSLYIYKLSICEIHMFTVFTHFVQCIKNVQSQQFFRIRFHVNERNA